MSFPRYPKYKDSGVEWLGEVPEHWVVKAIRLAAKLESGHTPSRSRPEYWENCTVPWITLADVWQIRDGKSDYIVETKEKVSELGLANSSARLLPKDTVVLSRTASVGYSAIMGADMATTQDFANWICGSGLLPRFLLSVFRGMRGEFDRMMMGSTHNTIYMPDIQALRFAEPPLPEQRAIAAFLDRETGKIDALVAEQRRLIELLQEKRQAVISHAVTKGLNPDAPMKPSGIDWLGDVPEHWEVGPLKRNWTVTDCKHVTADFVDEGYPLASIREVQGRYVELESAKRTTEEYYLQLIGGGRTPMPGDLIFSRNATVGEVAEVSAAHPKFAMGQDVCILKKCDPNFSTPFLHAVIRSPLVSEQLANLMIGSTFKRVNVEEIRNLVITVPPAREQTEIAETLALNTDKFDELMSEGGRAIDLLQERRTALISAAVTGKIDVRGLVDGEAA